MNSDQFLLYISKIYKKVPFKKVDCAGLNIKYKKIEALYLLKSESYLKKNAC